MDIPQFKHPQQWDSIFEDEICYIPRANGCDKRLVFTKQDFINMCGGDRKEAERLFNSKSQNISQDNAALRYTATELISA